MGGRALRLGWAKRPSAAARTDKVSGALRQGQTWQFAAWEIARLGSYHLGIYPWEVAA